MERSDAASVKLSQSQLAGLLTEEYKMGEFVTCSHWLLGLLFALRSGGLPVSNKSAASDEAENARRTMLYPKASFS